MSTSIRPGDTLADRYRLDDLLSESGSGRFWRAHDRVLQRKVALHVIGADDDRAPGLLEAARRSATVINPRILRVLDAQLRSDTCFVVNEWGYGTSLDIALANNGPLVPRRAAWVVAEVADSIATAHAHGVHHGRLVPENVLIDSTGNIRIIGLSVDAAMHGLPPGDELGDVRDLAGLLHAALTGKWAGESSSAVPAAPSEGGRVLRPRQVRAGVPRPLDDLVDELLNPATARRGARDLGSASAVAALLTDFVGDPAGISDTLAAANPCRAPEQVVLEQVPDFVPRPATPFNGPSPAPLPVSTPPPAAAGAGSAGDDDPLTTTAERPAVRDSGPDTSTALPRIHERRLQAAARAHAAGSTPTVASADPVAVPLRPTPLPAAAALASVRAVGRPVAVADPPAVAEPEVVAQAPSVADLVVVPAEVEAEAAVEADPEVGTEAAPATAPSEAAQEVEAAVARQGERSRLAELAHRYAEPEVVRDRPPAPRSRDAARRAAHAARASAPDPISSRIDYFTSLYSASGPTESGPVGGDESWEDEDWTDDGTWLVDPDDEDEDDRDGEQDGEQERDRPAGAAAAPRAAAGAPASYDAAGFARGDTAARIPAVSAPVRGPLFAPAHEDGPDRVAARRSRLRPGADDDRPWDREATGSPTGAEPSQHPWLEAQEREAAGDDEADRTAGSSGLRAVLADRRRLLLVLLSLLAVLLLVATLVTWRAGAGTSDAPPAATPPAPPAATGALVTGLTAEVFDPTGNPGGAAEGADLAVDGDPATSWTTGTFTEQFSPGGARPGLGLLVDTGSVQALSQVDLTLDGAPTYVVLYAVSELPQSLATLKPTADFQAGTSEQVGLPVGTTGRYVVVWLTQIPQVGANHEGGIAEVAVHS